MRCVHCHTTETPLWRAGPSGPKTLCNACGVRWKKTGSLIPRSKRPSTSTTSTSHASSSAETSAVRKRARPNPPPEPRLPLPAPAPRPVSVFRLANAQRSHYESVFSGLMVVRRDEPSTGRRRTATMKAANALVEDPASPLAKTGREDDFAPCPSPPPVDVADDKKAVYVTEVHAPSPSPSPPPMPRVTVQEGGTFRLLLAAVAENSKPAT